MTDVFGGCEGGEGVRRSDEFVGCVRVREGGGGTVVGRIKLGEGFCSRGGEGGGVGTGNGDVGSW